MPNLIRAAKERAKQSLHTLFSFGQHFGIDVLPRHFYSSIPDLRELRKTNGWKAPHSMHGISGAGVEQQLEFVRDCVREPMLSIAQREDIYESACRENGAIGYGPIEGEFLFYFAGRHKPKRVIQVGAGVSTALLLRSFKAVDHQAEIICIDPYPTEYLKKAAESGAIKLIAERCQDVDLSLYSTLGEGDLLFVDSTHTVKPGSEVNLLILEVLPRLNAGCHVHFHDIFFPYDYSSSVMKTTFFWDETALLLAFLTNNSRYAISASLSMLHHARAAELQELLPKYKPRAMEHGIDIDSSAGHFPSATYLRVSADRMTRSAHSAT